MNRFLLVFTDFDGMENDLGSARHTVKIPLDADSIQEAKTEASRLWKVCQETRGKTGWDKIRYPESPSLILEIDWTAD